MPMPATLTALFAEARNPKHCKKSDLKATNRPVLALAASYQQQLATLRALLNDVEQDDSVPDEFRGKFEFLHQGLRAAERQIAEYQEIGRKVTRTGVQIEEDFAMAFADLERAIAAKDEKK